MLVGNTKESDEDIQDGEGQEPNVSRVPGGFSRIKFVDPVGDDVVQVLDALSQQGSFGMTFVPGRVLGEHHSGRCLEELNRQRSKSWGSSVGDTTQSSEKESDDIEEVDAGLD